MRAARVGTLVMILPLVAACGSLGIDNAGSIGCQEAKGTGPAGMAPGVDGPVIDGVVGTSPAEAATFARALGHTVVFNVQIAGYGECWCVPPPEGTVAEAWWGQHGALWLGVDGVDVGHTKDVQPLLGWGC
jgi:hypothetical protein